MKTFLSRLLAWILRHFVRLIGSIIYRLRVNGVQNIPSTGGAILVANHLSYMDFVIMVCSVPRYVRFIMNEDVFKKPGLRWILNGLHCIPISPRGGKNKLEAFNALVKAQVDAGNVVAIFAEGTVSRTGQLLEFKKGIEHLSKIISAPVIPIHFDNVIGTPFSYRAGKGKMLKPSLNNIRRIVNVQIGQPTKGPLSSYLLRQLMKEMEVINFSRRFNRNETLDKKIASRLSKNPAGAWKSKTSEIKFSSIPHRLSLLEVALGSVITDDSPIAILLPKSPISYLCTLWLLMNKKCIVPIPPDFNNEERLFVHNTSGVRTIITTKDLNYTCFVPNADKIIYIEDLVVAIQKGKSVSAICKSFRSVTRGVSSLLKKENGIEATVALLFERKEKDEIRAFPLTHSNLLSVLTALRQIHHFEPGSAMVADLDLHNAYGLVVEFFLPLLSDLTLNMVDESGNSSAFASFLADVQSPLIIATPSQLEAVAQLSQVKNIPFLTSVFTSDIHPENHAVKILSKRGIEVMTCAGMNETTSVFAVNIHNYQGPDIVGKQLEQEAFEEGSLGKAIPGAAVKIANEQAEECAEEEPGFIWVKGPTIVSNLSPENESPDSSFNNWFNTGKRGKMNRRGFIFPST